MLGRRLSVCFIVLACTANFAHADDACNALLAHGIYDHFVETGASSSRSAAESGICRAYHQYESDSQHGDASGNYYDVISGNASYTGTQIKSIGDEMCSHSASSAGNENYTNVDRSVISPAAVQAWQQCTSNTLIATTTTFHDTDQGTEGFVLGFRLMNGGNDAKVVSVTSDNIKCQSAQLEPLITGKEKELPFGLITYSLDCTREVSDAPHQSGMRMVYAPAAHVNVVTTVGNITRDLPAILPPVPPNPVPLGAIIAWYGTTATVPAGWAICDGTGGTPDLRDKFIRGTGDFKKIGTPAGSNNIQAPSVNLMEGKSERAMRMDQGNGIVNHTTTATFLVNSYTIPTTLTFDGPPYVELMYIMKQ